MEFGPYQHLADRRIVNNNSRQWCGDAENAGLENAGLENAGTSCVGLWVAKCNIINVRGHVRVSVTISDFANHVFVTWKV